MTELVREQRAALIAVARQEGLDAEDALECVQDALATYLGLEDEGHGIATLKTIVRNAARNHRRRHHRQKPHLVIEDAESPSLPADQLLAHAEEMVRLQVCVAQLCSVQRAVIMLRLLDERSGEDVAAELGLTRSHVDVLVHRAKSSLRVCMHPAAHRRQ
ncbi:MAG TPA: sigma-70 family RNA polymerase sigma factor [Polyangiales bacterium]|nr:sigma-70 family RNA polymerase sigma factor [Polyangiales bacterium]